MNTPSANNSTVRHDRFVKAWNMVNDAWIPANPTLVRQIKQGLDQGKYDGNIDLLIDEMRSDVSLFCYCLRRLIEIAQEENRLLPEPADPITIFKWAGTAELQRVLEAANENLSLHKFDKMSELQALRFQESMISATTARALAEQSELDPELGFSAGLLRQLGLTLIAWNYPNIYERAMNNLGEEGRLDFALAKVLGFSPQLLGATMAKRWGLAPALRAAVGDHSVKREEHADAAEVAEALDKICRVGEALARANDPDHYPTARTDWNIARSEIESKLGVQGLKLIYKESMAHCHYYASQSPQFLKKTLSDRIERHVTSLAGHALFEHNRYIEHCSEPVQRLLKELYHKIDPHEISKDSISTLASSIIPTAGFIRGCIYVFDPSSVSLVPRLAIGMSQLTDFQTADCSPLSSSEDIVIVAYGADTPIVHEIVWDNTPSVAIGSVYGTIQRAGVLYLESSPELATDTERDPELIFHALCQTLADCLKLH